MTVAEFKAIQSEFTEIMREHKELREKAAPIQHKQWGAKLMGSPIELTQYEQTILRMLDEVEDQLPSVTQRMIDAYTQPYLVA